MNNQSFKAKLLMLATLLLFWLMLTGSSDLTSVLVGVAVSLVIVIILPSGLSFFTELKMTPKAVIKGFGYFFYFFAELIKSNFRLARVVLSPELVIRPSIVKVHTKLQSQMGRLMLANSITLTPGTLTVDIDGEWLFVHWVNTEATDMEAATQKIVAGFEYYLEDIYG